MVWGGGGWRLAVGGKDGLLHTYLLDELPYLTLCPLHLDLDSPEGREGRSQFKGQRCRELSHAAFPP